VDPFGREYSCISVVFTPTDLLLIFYRSFTHLLSLFSVFIVLRFNRYVALETKVMEFGIQSALDSDTPKPMPSQQSGGGEGGGGGGGNSGGEESGDAAAATSAIEETFALLQHAMTRAMRSGMLELACAAVNVSNSLFSSTTLNVLELREIKDDGRAVFWSGNVVVGCVGC
jgi:hypothetical protein